MDNPRALVIDANPKHFRWNPQFLELCGHYRIKPRACIPYRPRTKGKIERPFFYLEEQFVKGRTWQSLSHFLDELAIFEREDLDMRVHSTTQERPIDRFAQEQGELTPLPEQRFVGTKSLTRKVSWDCLVPFRGNRYSVPAMYAGKLVWLLLSHGNSLVILNSRRELLVEHAIEPGRGKTTILPEHYEPLRRGARPPPSRWPEAARSGALSPRLAAASTSRRGHLLGALEIERHVGNQVLDQREGLDGRDGDGLVWLEGVYTSHAHQARLAVDFGAAGATLAGFAVPPHCQVVGLGSLDAMNHVQHHHAFIQRRGVFRVLPARYVAAPQTERDAAAAGGGGDCSLWAFGDSRHQCASSKRTLRSSGISSRGSSLSVSSPSLGRITILTVAKWGSVVG